jgi:hypothetical protein
MLMEISNRFATSRTVIWPSKRFAPPDPRIGKPLPRPIAASKAMRIMVTVE